MAFKRRRKRVCYFCANKIDNVDYKNTDMLKRYISERGKILPRRNSAVCARHQRPLAQAIKKARFIALLPYVGE